MTTIRMLVLTMVAAGQVAAQAKAPQKGDAAAKAAPKAAAKAPAKSDAKAPAKAEAKAPAKAAPAPTMKAEPKPAPAAKAAAAPTRDPNKWPELVAFEDAMMAAHHPLMQGSDTKVARATAGNLLTLALAMRKSHGPAKCDTRDFRAGMADFITDMRSAAHAAKTNASDDAVTVSLNRAHDGFMKMAAPCMGDMMESMKKGMEHDGMPMKKSP